MGCTRDLWCGPDGSAAQELGLRASAKNGTLSIDIDESRQLFHSSCPERVEVYTWPAASEPYRDERPYGPPGTGYYLDGEFLTVPSEDGCGECRTLVDFELPLRSVVQEGTRTPPPGIQLPEQRSEVPTFVSRPYSGPLAIELDYRRDSNCSSPASTAFITISAE